MLVMVIRAVVITFVGILWMGSAIAQQSEPEHPRGLVVKDSTGKLVGYVFDAENNTPTIILSSAGIFFRVAVAPNGLQRTVTNDVLKFETSDCSGTGYLSASSGVLVNGVVIGPPDTTAYIPDPAASPRTILVNSLLEGDTCDTPSGSSHFDKQVPAIKIALSAYYTPPFSLVPQGCCGDCNEDGTIAINELVTAVNSALYGCPTP
jgi:hypothetical protein